MGPVGSIAQFFPPPAHRTGRFRPASRCSGVFAFFSSNLGCVGSIIVSVAVTLLLGFLMHGCGGATGP